jgi:hypothetical protein
MNKEHMAVAQWKDWRYFSLCGFDQRVASRLGEEKQQLGNGNRDSTSSPIWRKRNKFTHFLGLSRESGSFFPFPAFNPGSRLALFGTQSQALILLDK